MQDLKEMHRRLVPPMVEGEHNLASVTDKICDLTLKIKTPFFWFI